MSISVALSNALSGLGSVGRAAQVVSSNISNALTEGYGRRDIELSSRDLGGVRVDGVTRVVNSVVLSDRRLADAATGLGAQGLDFRTSLADLLGAADSGASLPGRIATLEGRLIEAASRPDSATRLQSVADGARALVKKVAATGAGIQSLRQDADRAIAADVERLNSNLARIADLNGSIARLSGTGADANGLLDQRQRLVDDIAQIVPLREIARDRNVVALITTGGQILLDGRAARIEFTASNAVAPGMTIAGGQLSGLTLNGEAVTLGTGAGRMDGGRLEGNFRVRDILGPEAQAQIDAFARDLIQRFEDPSVDPTRAPGDPGLFTDAGGVLSVAPPPGLAQRLGFNPLADATQGGAGWRLRDGLGAATDGSVGNATILQALSDALASPRNTPTVSGKLSSAGFAAELVNRNSGALFRLEQDQTFTQTRAQTLREQELRGGVDSDQEMQKLLLVEQAYAANARVIQVVDDMLRRLMEI